MSLDNIISKDKAFEKHMIESINVFFSEGAQNQFSEINGTYYDAPLIQFAAADHPIFEAYKEIIGPYHMTPQEVFNAFNMEKIMNAGTVISIVMPINQETRQQNRSERTHGSKAWALTRYYGDEIFLDALVEHVTKFLKSYGYWSIAPARSSLFKDVAKGRDISSNWSERHMAYAAGLGTFSLNDAFITEKGIAVKMVSILTDAVFEQSPMPFKDYKQNCLWEDAKTCGACIKRCPVGAITEKGHDKIKCYFHCYGESSAEIAKAYGGHEKFGTGCGLCQTGVPCEQRNPNAKVHFDEL